jgi:hypothetical protein
MVKKESAEEKLLKIIEANKKAKIASSAASATPSMALAKHSPKFSFSAPQINLLLIVGVLASLFFLIYEVKSGMGLLEQKVSISVDAKASKDPVNLLIPQMKGLSYYFEKTGSRNIFRPYERPEAGAVSVTSARAVLEKKMAKYKLVGIAWLDLPESATVMLEDSATHMTHFLREGDKIEDVTVKTIYTDRAVFSYANEEIITKL